MKIKRIFPNTFEFPMKFEYFMELNNLTLVIRSKHTGSVNDHMVAAFEVNIQNSKCHYADIYKDSYITLNYITLKGRGPTEYLAIKDLVEKLSSSTIRFGKFVGKEYIKVSSLYPYSRGCLMFYLYRVMVGESIDYVITEDWDLPNGILIDIGDKEHLNAIRKDLSILLRGKGEKND